MSLRVGIDARPALWPRTGIGTIVLNVIRRIGHIDPANEYFFYFDREPSPLNGTLPADRMFSGSSRNDLVWANTFMRSRMAKDRLDIYLTFLEKEIPFFTGPTAVICMVHDLIPLHFPDAVFRNGFHKIYYKKLLRAATASADLVLTNSEFSRQEIMAELKLPAEKVRKITLGIDTDFTVTPAQQAIAAIESLDPGDEYILAVGSTEPRKNNEKVLRAFQRLAVSHPDLKLVVVGKPWRGRKFQDFLLNNRVVLTGYVADETLAVLYRKAKAFVFPSLHEGFGLPVLEAMAAGTPVITSRRSALPEVGADAALYVDAEDEEAICVAIERVLSDPVLRSELVEKGRTWSAKFRWEGTCRELSAIFHELANGADVKR